MAGGVSEGRYKRMSTEISPLLQAAQVCHVSAKQQTVKDDRLLLTGDSAQNPRQSAYFAKNPASERMDFNLSSPKPRSSSSLTRPSYKSLPNTCLSCEYR